MPEVAKTCPKCGGSKTQPCGTCGGSGTVNDPRCNGTGKNEDDCPQCHGSGMLPGGQICGPFTHNNACRTPGCSRGQIRCTNGCRSGYVDCDKCSGYGTVMVYEPDDPVA